MKKVTFTLMMLLVISLISATISCTRESQPPANNVQEVSSVAIQEPASEPIVVAQAEQTTPARAVDPPPARVEPVQETTVVAQAEPAPAAEAVADPNEVLHGIWKTPGEREYAWAAQEFRRGIPDGEVRRFSWIQFNPDGTLTGFHGSFRYVAPRGNQVNHENYINESNFTGTYSLDGNYLTIQGSLEIRTLTRYLGNQRNARPRTNLDNTRSSAANETINLTFSFRTAGEITGFSFASGGTSFILEGILYEKQ